jgi:hypothetical protein
MYKIFLQGPQQWASFALLLMFITSHDYINCFPIPTHNLETQEVTKSNIV